MPSGSKRNKIKKAFSPPSSAPPPPAVEDDGLIDDLVAQLDAQDDTVKTEAATVLTEINKNASSTPPDATRSGKDSKSRFEARKVSRVLCLRPSEL